MKSPYKLGYEAYYEGKKHHDCPYHPETSQADEWYDGWEFALREDESSTNES